MMPLTSLQPGQRATVREISGGRGVHRRLASMGLTVGSEVISLISRGRGPVAIVVKQTRLALGRGIAAKILVEVVEA